MFTSADLDPLTAALGITTADLFDFNGTIIPEPAGAFAFLLLLLRRAHFSGRDNRGLSDAQRPAH